MKIILHDGTEIPNLVLNGSNYISPVPVDEAIFEGNLTTMTVVDDDGNSVEYYNVELVQQVHYSFADGWWLCFRELSAQELKEREFETQLLGVDETAVALYEALAEQESINTAQDEVLVEIYERTMI